MSAAVTDWFSAGLTGPTWNSRELLVRVWHPGDGVRCSSSGYNARIPCSEPVAVVKAVLQQEPRRDCSVAVTRVFCIRHLARTFDRELGTPAEHDVERKALEELASRYWDQFSQIKIRMENELLQARFSVLPQDLQDQVIALLNESDDE